MNLKCLLGSHDWKGCLCSRCGKTRDEGHEWSQDCEKCVKCGKARTDAHDWGKDCEKCAKCPKARTNAHDWSKDCERCEKCGKLREKAHKWQAGKCSICGRTADEIVSGCVGTVLKDGPLAKSKAAFATLQNLGREEAVLALMNLETMATDDFLRRLATESLDRTLSGVEPSVQTLTYLLKHSQRNIRSTAVLKLRFSKDTRAAGPLTKLLKDPDKLVRDTVVQALGEVGDRGSLEPLIRGIEDHALSLGLVASAVAKIAGRELQSYDEAVNILERRLADKGCHDKPALAHVLVEIGGERAKQLWAKVRAEGVGDVNWIIP